MVATKVVSSLSIGVCFLGGEVAGFGSSPKGPEGRSSDPSQYIVDKFDADGNCLSDTVIDGFCYSHATMPQTCQSTWDGCQAGNDFSKNCENYDWYILIEQCPPKMAAGTNNMCPDLNKFTPVASGSWCNGLNQLDCEDHYQTWEDNAGTQQYQMCEYRKSSGRCRGLKRRYNGQSYKIVQPCGEFCKEDVSNKDNISPDYCSTGAQGAGTPLTLRLNDQSACENSYAISVATGAKLQCMWMGGVDHCAVGSGCACDTRSEEYGCGVKEDWCCLNGDCTKCDELR